MAFDTATARDAILSHLGGLGFFDTVIHGEFVSPPSGRFNAAVKLAPDAIAVMGLTGSTVIERWGFLIRIYAEATFDTDTDGRIEQGLAEVAGQTMEAIAEDFTLGAVTNLRNVDIAGEYGLPLSVNTGYVTIDNRVHRIADINVSLIVDDAIAQAS